MHQRGVISIWVGWLRSRKQLSGYLEELYWDDEAHRSRFASDFELYDYDDYAMEAEFSEAGGLFELLKEASHSASFRDTAIARAQELGLADPSTVVILYDFEFVQNGAGRVAAANGGVTAQNKRRDVIFLGTFRYVRGDRAS